MLDKYRLQIFLVCWKVNFTARQGWVKFSDSHCICLVWCRPCVGIVTEPPEEEQWFCKCCQVAPALTKTHSRSGRKKTRTGGSRGRGRKPTRRRWWTSIVHTLTQTYRPCCHSVHCATPSPLLLYRLKPRFHPTQLQFNVRPLHTLLRLPMPEN